MLPEHCNCSLSVSPIWTSSWRGSHGGCQNPRHLKTMDGHTDAAARQNNHKFEQETHYHHSLEQLKLSYSIPQLKHPKSSEIPNPWKSEEFNHWKLRHYWEIKLYIYNTVYIIQCVYILYYIYSIIIYSTILYHTILYHIILYILYMYIYIQ